MWRSLILVLLCAVGHAAMAQTHGQHTSATVTDGQYNPFIAAGPQGGFYLVYVQRTAGVSDVMLRVSRDGRTFSDPVRVNDRAGDATVRNENPPKVVIAPNGDVYVCWASERARWKGDIRFARSVDSGKTFSPAITLNSDAGGEPAGHAFQSIAVDRRGRIYAAWIDERNKQRDDRGAEIWLTTSTDRGRTFATDRRILSDVCECCRTSLQVDAAGRIYLSYRMVPRTGPMLRNIVLARSQDGGRTFTPTVVSQDGWEVNGCPVVGPTFAIGSGGNITVAWFVGGGERAGLYFSHSGDGGSTFAPRRLLDPQQKIGKHAHLAPLPGGQVFAVWDDAQEQTFSVRGLLDPRKGLVWRSRADEGVAFPVVAASGQTAVIVGLRLGTREIAISTENLSSPGEVRPVSGQH